MHIPGLRPFIQGSTEVGDHELDMETIHCMAVLCAISPATRTLPSSEEPGDMVRKSEAKYNNIIL